MGFCFLFGAETIICDLVLSRKLAMGLGRWMRRVLNIGDKIYTSQSNYHSNLSATIVASHSQRRIDDDEMPKQI